MKHPVDLPALDGRDPLGFLAALGLLRLLTDETSFDVDLSFNDDTARAVLHSPLVDLTDVVEQLTAILASIPDDGVIPSVPATFPEAKVGTAKDPMRSPRVDYRSAHTALTGDNHNPALDRWLSALVTDLATDSQGRVAITPYAAPAGQQSFRTMFTKTLEQIRPDPPNRFHEALTRWRRVEGYTGEYLDHRAIRTAADHPTGTSLPAGVPAATWLALMALPLLRLTGTGTKPRATCWHHLNHQQPVMTWPLWRQPLDTHAVSALLEHPAHRNRNAWPALGIFTTASAIRTTGKNSAGTLTPATDITTR
ncbi:hypothetical protein ABZ652_24340 [Micromonospora chalcea]|uniref:type I-G CRISPR-associated protein, Cas3-extension family n=1 Tax=Micromonospora chalcea TaxID=1874 RepID=UPI0004C3348A|nr:hypothetical protein [Micromonospora purpureochromogenes]